MYVEVVQLTTGKGAFFEAGELAPTIESKQIPEHNTPVGQRATQVLYKNF